MTLKLHHLRPAPGAKTAKTRVGRGEGSKGKTAGRGTKGTKARYQVPACVRGRPDAPAHAPAQAEGLQEPLQGRVPGRQPATGSASCSPRAAPWRRRPRRQGRGPQGPAGQGARPGRPRRSPSRSAPTRSPAPPRRRSRLPAAPPPSSDASAPGAVRAGTSPPGPRLARSADVRYGCRGPLLGFRRPSRRRTRARRRRSGVRSHNRSMRWRETKKEDCSARRIRQRVPDSGPAQEAVVRPVRSS